MPTKTTAPQILDLETSFWKALEDQDIGKAAELSDDACLVLGRQGIEQSTAIVSARWWRRRRTS